MPDTQAKDHVSVPSCNGPPYNITHTRFRINDVKSDLGIEVDSYRPHGGLQQREIVDPGGGTALVHKQGEVLHLIVLVQQLAKEIPITKIFVNVRNLPGQDDLVVEPVQQ
jgi:hypothetical protein